MKKILVFILMLLFPYLLNAGDKPAWVTTLSSHKIGVVSPIVLSSYPSFETLDYNFNRRKACQQSLQNEKSLDAKIMGCPFLRETIQWQEGDAHTTAYENWSADKKMRLDDLYQQILSQRSVLDLQCPASGEKVYRSQRFFTSNQAFDIYAAYVAHALYLEIQQLVPWTLWDYSKEQLQELFYSNKLFSTISSVTRSTAYPEGIRPGRDYQTPYRARYDLSYNCDPRLGYRFMKGLAYQNNGNLLGAYPGEALMNLTDWMRKNLSHGETSDLTQARLEQQSSLESKLRRLDSRRTLIAIYGCHSAANLFYELARSVNLPLTYAISQFDDNQTLPLPSRGHAALIYGIGTNWVKILQHVDDVYANGFSDFYPMVMNETERKVALFNAFWLSPNALRDQNFMASEDLFSLVLPGIDWGVNPLAEEDRSSYAPFAGYWLDNAAPTQSSNKVFNIKRMVNNCGAEFMIYYCSFSANTFEVTYSTLFSNLSSSARERLNTNATQLYNRAAQCVNSVGGCENFNHLHQEWQNSRGSNIVE